MKCSNIICVFFVSTILAVYKCDNDKRNPEATAKVIEAVQTTCGKESQKLGKLIHENRVTLRKQEAVCECFGNYRACLQKEGVIPRRVNQSMADAGYYVDYWSYYCGVCSNKAALTLLLYSLAASMLLLSSVVILIWVLVHYWPVLYCICCASSIIFVF